MPIDERPISSLGRALALLAERRDRQAWACVLRQAGTDLERVAARVAGAALAADAVQEALLQIRDHAANFHPQADDPDGSAKRWILRIAGNVALNLVRRQTRAARHETVAATSRPCEDDVTSSAIHEQREEADLVRAALAELAEVPRSAVLLHHIAGLTFDEVAKELRLPIGTAKTHVRRGLERMRTSLKRSGLALSVAALVGTLNALPAATSTTLSAGAGLLLAPAKASTFTLTTTGSIIMASKIALGAAALAVATSVPYAFAEARTAPNGEFRAGDKPTFDVQAFGAVPDDGIDDTASIQKAIDAAPDKQGAIIYFPPGVYDVADVKIRNRDGLAFRGKSRESSVVKRCAGERIATIENSANLRIANLGSDANGNTNYGGWCFYTCAHVVITDNRFFDSNPQPAAGIDHYSVVFARGATPSTDLEITDNLVQDLQLEVDEVQRALIKGNRVERPVNTCGIGIFTINDGAIAEDLVITGNTVIDPVVSAGGIVVLLDPPQSNNCVFRRITIADNTIKYTSSIKAAFASAVRIGTGDSSIATNGNIFDHIDIVRNRIVVDAKVKFDFHSPIIFGNAYTPSNFLFTTTNVSDNQIFYDGSTKAVDIRMQGENYVEKDNVVLSANDAETKKR